MIYVDITPYFYYFLLFTFMNDSVLLLTDKLLNQNSCFVYRNSIYSKTYCVME